MNSYPWNFAVLLHSLIGNGTKKHVRRMSMKHQQYTLSACLRVRLNWIAVCLQWDINMKYYKCAVNFTVRWAYKYLCFFSFSTLIIIFSSTEWYLKIVFFYTLPIMYMKIYFMKLIWFHWITACNKINKQKIHTCRVLFLCPVFCAYSSRHLIPLYSYMHKHFPLSNHFLRWKLGFGTRT